MSANESTHENVPPAEAGGSVEDGARGDIRQGSSTADGTRLLELLAGIARELGCERVESEALDLAERIADGRFYVACIGQFKRGKSTLINALIKDRVLPVGITPVTAVPTVVRFGGRRCAHVQRENGSPVPINVADLAQFVSEECNPENAKRIRGVQVWVPSPLLAGGMCFVDTPGLGSVFAGNTAATQAFLPHIDAAMVVIGADPPLAGEELALVETLGRQVRDIVVVLNKADRANPDERAAAASFARQQIEKRLGRSVGGVFEVSAAEMLDGKGTDRDSRKLVAALENLAGASGGQLTRSACERGIGRLSEQLLTVIVEEREALQRPIADSERRISTMKRIIAEAERSMRDLGYLFMGEQQRLSDVFVDRHKSFMARVAPQAREEFETAIVVLRYGTGPAYRRRVMKEAQEVAKTHVLPWLKPEREEGERRYRQLSLRFVEIGNEFLRKLAEAGIPELARMPHALDPEVGFRVRSRFTFKEFIQIAQPASPLRWVGDCVLVAAGARSRITTQARAFLEHLLETNSTRVQSDILDRVQESRGQLEAEIRKVLHEVRRIAERALTNAKALHEKGAPAVEAALQKFALLERQVIDVATQSLARQVS